MVRVHRRVIMEPIVPLPDGEYDADSDEFRLVRVEFESGGDDFEDVTVFNRTEWLEDGGSDNVWTLLAQQEVDGYDIGVKDDLRLVTVELPGWWVENEAEEAGSGDMTWRRAYGRVYGEQQVIAAVDYEWSRDRAAWSFPWLRNDDSRWVSPGKFGPGGPKSLLPVVFPVGTPKLPDGEKVRVRDAREAAEGDPDAGRYDWGAAVGLLEDRIRKRESMQDEELDISAIETLEDQHRACYHAGTKAFTRLSSDLNDELGVDPDPVTLTQGAEAIAEALREREGLDDPR